MCGHESSVTNKESTRTGPIDIFNSYADARFRQRVSGARCSRKNTLSGFFCRLSISVGVVWGCSFLSKDSSTGSCQNGKIFRKFKCRWVNSTSCRASFSESFSRQGYKNRRQKRGKDVLVETSMSSNAEEPLYKSAVSVEKSGRTYVIRG